MGNEGKALEYATAVAVADNALTAILSQFNRPDGKYTPQERNTVGAAFYDWLYQHPEVHEALDPDGEMEGAMFEDQYIVPHSQVFEVVRSGILPPPLPGSDEPFPSGELPDEEFDDIIAIRHLQPRVANG